MFLGNFSIISCFPNRILCVKHDLTNLAIVFININFNEMTFFLIYLVRHHLMEPESTRRAH